MADPLPPYPDSNDDTSVGPDHESPPTTPGWVKGFGIAFLLLVLLIVIMMVGGHGPGRHMSGTGLSGRRLPSSVTEQIVHPL